VATVRIEISKNDHVRSEKLYLPHQAGYTVKHANAASVFGGAAQILWPDGLTLATCCR
jgi:hypothetical protein